MSFYLPIAIVVLSNVFYHVCSKSISPKIDPFAALTVTYGIGALVSAALYALLNQGENLLREYQHLNWSSLVLGLAIVGLEAGSIYMYQVGWELSTGQLVSSSILAVILLFVGALWYREAVTVSKMLGILICLVGLYFINR